MAKLQFAFSQGGKLQTMTFDATIKEVFDHTADVTDYPVEEGSNISDHIREKPSGLILDAVITDNPLQNDGRSKASSGNTDESRRPAQEEDRSLTAFETLVSLQNKGIAIGVYTGLKDYPKMGLTGIHTEKNKDTKNGWRGTLTLKAITVVSSESVVVTTVNEPKGKAKKTDGKKTPKEANDNQKKRAALSVEIYEDAKKAVKSATGN